MTEELSRAELLLGGNALETLSRSRVAVFGVGGVGGYAVEALARCGIGALDVIDSDRVSRSNINRQILALQSTVGQLKTDVAAARIKDISPETVVRVYPVFFLPENADGFDFLQYDYVIDAVDTVAAKVEIAARAQKAGVPVISAMGAGNKLDPTRFRVADIYETKVCPLCRAMRGALKKRGINRLKVVYSEEAPIAVLSEDGGHPIPGSVSFVPSVMGLILAGEVIRDLAEARS